MVREAAEAVGVPVAILADLQGPKIRLGRFADGPHEWRTGDSVVITGDDILGTQDRVSCTYRKLPAGGQARRPAADRRRPGRRRGHRRHGNDIRCLVTEGGPVSNNKGVSLPNVAVSVPAMSDKDAEDLRFALGLGVDLVALSFVRSADDIKLVHSIMDEEGVRRPVLAKVEKPEAVDHLEAIVLAFDGVMVARGDLGVEMPLDQVPLVQKRAVQLCRENAKPVIVATQMLDSMIENSRPTRAEASDVANAVLDGADAVMLSGETSVGKYPVLTVSTMAKIITTTEAGSIGVPRLQHDPRTHGGALTVGRVHRSPAPSAPRRWSPSRRPATPSGGSPGCTATCRCWPSPRSPEVRDQLALSLGRGDLPDAVRRSTPTTCSARSTRRCSASAWRQPGDYVVIVAGSPPGTPGSTNTLRVHQLGSLVDAASDASPAVSDGRRRGRPGRGRPAPRGPRPRPASARRPSGAMSPPVGPQRVFGGQVAGQALVAAGRTVDPERFVHSLHGYFVRPGDPAEPIDYQVENIRDGRSFSVRRSVALAARQADLLHVGVVPACSEQGLDHQAPAPPDVPGPDDVPTMADRLARYPERLGIWSPIPAPDRRPLRRRARLGAAPATAPADPYQRVWMRIDGKLPDDPLLHACALTYASDLTLLDSVLSVHGEVWGPGGVVGASLDHALWFHRPFRADEWFLYDCWSPSASGARGLATGRHVHPRRPAHRQRRPGGPAAPRRRVTRQRRRPTARHLREQKATRQVPTGRPVRSC